MPNGKIYPLTNDICFKYIFSKAIILKDFLNSFFLFIGKKEKVVSVKSNTEVELFGSKYKHKVFYGDKVNLYEMWTKNTRIIILPSVFS